MRFLNGDDLAEIRVDGKMEVRSKANGGACVTPCPLECSEVDDRSNSPHL